MNEPEEAMDLLAESVTDQMLSAVVIERREIVDRALASLVAAQRALAAADLDLRTWRRHREFDHTTAIKALQATKLADFVPSAVPPGTYPKAVTDYLKAHPPVWNAPRNRGPLNTIHRAAGAVVKAALRTLMMLARMQNR